MKIIAHRGFSKSYPENTAEAFERALDTGAAYIECDVQQVEDDFFIYHDFYLDRLTFHSGRFTDASCQDIATLQTISGQKVITLAELFNIVGNKATLNLEIKTLENADLFIQQLSQLMQTYDTKIILSSFNHPLILKLKSKLRGYRILDNIKFAAVIAHLPIDLAAFGEQLEVDIVVLEGNQINQAFVTDAHQRFLEVWCYTVNHSDLLTKLKNFGVDAVFSDDPQWALQTLADNS
ncbi:glycerophosphodiester phosphodiesterase [Glaciecola sp. 1036]|uniref:glycerophosphodiester phosphodiesterase n=1 Tax=Alteromonadaceae TaxID=72275 RepID=UPI003CFD0922